MLLYSLLSFWRLGSFKEPNTFTETRELNFKLDTKQQITKVVFFTGHEVKQVQISLLMGEEEFLLPMPTDIYVFNWYEIGVNAEIDGLKIELAEETSLGEIAVLCLLYTSKLLIEQPILIMRIIPLYAKELHIQCHIINHFLYTILYFVLHFVSNLE